MGAKHVATARLTAAKTNHIAHAARIAALLASATRGISDSSRKQSLVSSAICPDGGDRKRVGKGFGRRQPLYNSAIGPGNGDGKFTAREFDRKAFIESGIQSRTD